MIGLKSIDFHDHFYQVNKSTFFLGGGGGGEGRGAFEVFNFIS